MPDDVTPIVDRYMDERDLMAVSKEVLRDMRYESEFEATQRREAARRRQARAGIVSILAVIAVGVFVPDPVSYIIAVVTMTIVGLIAQRAGRA